MALQEVTISQEGLINYFTEQLASFDGTDESAGRLASAMGVFCWDLMMHNVGRSKEHLELFIYRIQKMRAVQKQFFEGKKSVLKTAQQLEAKADMAIDKMLGPMGYSIDKIKQKEEQSKLF